MSDTAAGLRQYLWPSWMLASTSSRGALPNCFRRASSALIASAASALPRVRVRVRASNVRSVCVPRGSERFRPFDLVQQLIEHLLGFVRFYNVPHS